MTRQEPRQPADAVSPCPFQAHPGVPVVDNLEDIWRVSKLQRERKAEAEAKKKAHLARMQVRGGHGPLRTSTQQYMGLSLAHLMGVTDSLMPCRPTRESRCVMV